MFRSLFRAILVLGGGVATGIAVYTWLDGMDNEAKADPPPATPQSLEVDADAVPAEEKEALLDELEAQL